VDASTTAPAWASVWERQLIDYLNQHTEHEGQLLHEYVAAARETDSKALAYLLDILVEDELRHHAWFRQLARTVEAGSNLNFADPPVPHFDLDRADSAALLEVTKRLIANERNDLKELRRLRKELRSVEDTTLWALLVDIMIRDTEKHLAILRFAQGHRRKRVH